MKNTKFFAHFFNRLCGHGKQRLGKRGESMKTVDFAEPERSWCNKKESASVKINRENNFSRFVKIKLPTKTVKSATRFQKR